MNEDTPQQKQKLALAKIKSIHGTPEDEFGPSLFVSHHIEEIEDAYWINNYGTKAPPAEKILDSLVLVGSWSSNDDDKIDTFDFSLPGNVTNYLISVRFDETGDIDEISMES